MTSGWQFGGWSSGKVNREVAWHSSSSEGTRDRIADADAIEKSLTWGEWANRPLETRLEALTFTVETQGVVYVSSVLRGQ